MMTVVCMCWCPFGVCGFLCGVCVLFVFVCCLCVAFFACCVFWCACGCLCVWREGAVFNGVCVCVCECSKECSGVQHTAPHHIQQPVLHIITTQRTRILFVPIEV